MPHLQPVCSSGDCQWRSVSSLAICSAVIDVSDQLTISNQTTARSPGVSPGSANDETVREARLPNGLFLAGSTTTCNLNISWPHPSANTTSSDQESAKRDGGADDDDNTQQGSFLPTRTSLTLPEADGKVASAIANFFLVYTTPANQKADAPHGSTAAATSFRAAEVLVHFCVNTYHVSAARGVASSAVVHSSALVSGRDAIPSTGRLLRMHAADGGRGDGGMYAVQRDQVKLLHGYIRSLFAGTYSHASGKAMGSQTATSEALGAAMFREGLDAEGMRAAVVNLTANVATSLTNTQVDFLSLPVLCSCLLSCLYAHAPFRMTSNW